MLYAYLFEFKERVKQHYLSRKIVVIPPVLTIYELQKGKSISRFGDGEFYIMNGSAIRFQKFDPILQKRLVNIFSQKNESHIIGIYEGVNPKNLKYFSKDQKDWTKKHLKYMLPLYLKFVDLKHIYGSAYISRFWLPYKNKEQSKQICDEIKKIWSNKDVIIVEGEKTRMGVGNDLFDSTKSVKRILCPAENAFDKYNEIISVCLEMPKSSLFLIALGPTATVLSYDLYKSGYQALDIGHIDLEYEWMKMGATEKVDLSNKYVNELENGNIVSDNGLDRYYFDQIITKIL